MNYPDYVFQDQWLDLGGMRLHYLDEGPKDAPPVVMLHGNPTWSFYYRRVVAALRENHRTIVPDHIGMGLSDKPDEGRYEYTLSRRVDDLEKLLDSLNLRQPITLIVHDWGGMIGLTYATRHPEKIARLVVLNTGAFSLPAGMKMPWQLTLARTPGVGALLVRGFNAFSAGAVRDCVMRPMDAETKRAYLAPYRSWADRLAVHRFIQDIPLRAGDRAFDVIAHVEKNLRQFQRLPMLICWGMKDFVFDVHFLNRWLDFFPQAEVHHFPDAGHYVLEDAGDEIIPLIQQFLVAHPVEASTS